MNKNKLHLLTQAAMIAALYVVLTFIANAFGLANYAVQVRFSEALTILPLFTPAAIPGLTAGCLISNILTGCALPDIVFGSAATLIGALGTWKLGEALSRKAPPRSHPPHSGEYGHRSLCPSLCLRDPSAVAFLSDRGRGRGHLLRHPGAAACLHAEPVPFPPVCVDLFSARLSAAPFTVPAFSHRRQTGFRSLRTRLPHRPGPSGKPCRPRDP